MRVRDCGVSPPVVLSPAASLSAAGRLMALRGVRHAIVIDGGGLAGVVSTRALGAAHPSAVTSLTAGEIRGRLARVTVADVMARDLLVVSPATPLAEAVRLVRDSRLEVLVVRDQHGVVGLLTANDLLGVLDRLVPPE
jgi:CBS domain-containing protein